MSTPDSDPHHTVRERFTSLTRAHLLDAPPLLGRVRIVEPERDEWERAFQALRPDVFPRATGVEFSRVFDSDERARFAEIDAVIARGVDPLAHRLLFVDGEGERAPIVGAYFGVQESQARYYMVATMIRREWQGRGLYTSFLRAMIAVLREMGFREIYSRHSPDNGAVLVPKLKAGFVINSFEISAPFGLLVHLKLALGDNLRRVYAWRVEATVEQAALVARGILGGGASSG
jgi:hypothetical protein